MTMTSVGVMQEFTRTEKREARAQRYAREADKALAEKDSRLASIQRDTALAWLDRYYAEAMAAVVAEQSTQARVEIEAAETAYRAGRGNLADVVMARSALVSLDDRASEMGRRVSAAKIALARWIGSDAESPLAGRPAIDSIRLDSQTLDEDLQQTFARLPPVGVARDARCYGSIVLSGPTGQLGVVWVARLHNLEKGASWSLFPIASRRSSSTSWA